MEVNLSLLCAIVLGGVALALYRRNRRLQHHRGHKRGTQLQHALSTVSSRRSLIDGSPAEIELNDVDEGGGGGGGAASVEDCYAKKDGKLDDAEIDVSGLQKNKTAGGGVIVGCLRALGRLWSGHSEADPAETAAESVPRRAQATLDAAIRAALTCSPGARHEVVAHLTAAIDAAEQIGVGASKVSEAKRRLREAEALEQQRKRSGAVAQMSGAIAAVDAAADAAHGTSGACAFLRFAYGLHPPKHPSMNAEALDALDATRSAQLRKALLKAQKDYHPDRNKALVRETLNYSEEEWEVLSLAICQHLAHIYDQVYKGERA